MKLISGNVNGLRSVLRQGFLDFLARPKQNVGNHGFMPEERAGFAALLAAGITSGGARGAACASVTSAGALITS